MAKQPKIDNRNLFKRGGVWYVHKLVDGKRLVQSTREIDAGKARDVRDEILEKMKLTEKRERLAAVQASIDGVNERLAEINDKTAAMGLLEAWTSYRGALNRPDAGQRTLADYELQWGVFTEWMKEHYPQIKELRHVTEEMAAEFASQLVRTRTPNTFNKYICLLKRIWAVLAKNKKARLTVNPWREIEPRTVMTHSRRELSIEELSRVCASLEGEMRVLFAIGLYCGLRLGDAALLDWGHVDLVRGTITVTPSKTARKANGRVVQIPIHAALHGLLSETPAEGRTGFVVPGLAKAYQHDRPGLVRQIGQIFEKCGIRTQSQVEGHSRAAVDVGFHSLRHSFVSLSANAGAPLALVQAVVGHSNPAMTRHYLHADLQAVRGAVGLLPDVTGAPLPSPAAARPRGGDVEAALAMLESLDIAGLKTVAAKAQELIMAKGDPQKPGVSPGR